MFDLEVLKAKQGDCLILHHGDEAAPRHILIDGGPRGVYRKHLKPTLKALQNGSDKPVTLDLVMVSHIDHDHIRGILDLTDELSKAIEDKSPHKIAEIRTLWHNSFADFTKDSGPDKDDEPLRPREARAEKAGRVSERDLDLVLQEHTKLTLSSVKEGRKLRNAARKLKIAVNPKAKKGLVLSGHETKNGALTLKVIGPTQAEVNELKETWDDEVEKLLEEERKEKKVEAAEYLDDSVSNLSSLIVIAEMGGKRMLLTGDARGDQIIKSLKAHNLLDKNGKAHFELLKLPHHGSDRNVEVDFFRTVTADHYVISGDGHHGNPELETYHMLFEARRKGDTKKKEFTLHMTYAPEDMHRKYPADELEDLFDDEWDKGTKFEVNFPEDGEHSMTIKLS